MLAFRDDADMLVMVTLRSIGQPRPPPTTMQTPLLPAPRGMGDTIELSDIHEMLLTVVTPTTTLGEKPLVPGVAGYPKSEPKIATWPLVSAVTFDESV